MRFVGTGAGVRAARVTNLPLSGSFGLAAYDRARASDVAAFQAALSTAQANSAMRGPVQSVLPSFAGIQAQGAALVTLGTYPTFLNVGQVQRVAGLMYDSGMTSNPLSVTSMLSG